MDQTDMGNQQQGMNLVLQILLIYLTFVMILKNISEQTEGLCEFLGVNEIVYPPVDPDAYN
jgi:hypothetical protein